MPQKDINKLLLEFDNIEKQLLKKLNEVDKDADFDKMIDVMTDYPEYKSLIKFIVKLNDNVSNSQSKISDAMSEAISEMIEKKKSILQIIDNLHINKAPKPVSTKKIELSKIPKEGWAIFGITFIAFLAFLFLMFHPEKTETIIKGAAQISNSNKGNK